MSNHGWISLHRKIQDTPIYSDSHAVHLWVHLLLKANHQDKEFLFNGVMQSVKRGQLLTGRKALSSETGINESKIQRLLKTFEKCKMIEQQSSNKSRLISITKYDSHQVVEQQVNNTRTTDEQQVNTNNNVNNDNNVNKRDSDKPKFVFKRAVIELGVDDETASHWMAVRKNKKAANTELALKQVITQSAKANITPAEAINFAANEGWASFKAEWFFNSRNSTGANQPKKTQGTLDDLDNYAENLLL